MTEYRNRTFYHIARCLCLVMCEGEHTTLLWLLVTSLTLVVSSLLTLGVLLLTRVLLPLLALGYCGCCWCCCWYGGLCWPSWCCCGYWGLY